MDPPARGRKPGPSPKPARAGPGLEPEYVGPGRASGRKVLIASGLVGPGLPSAFEFSNQQFQNFCKIISFDFLQIPRLNLLSYFSVYLLTTHNIAPFIYYFILTFVHFVLMQDSQNSTSSQIRYQLVRKLDAISWSINSNQP